MQQLAISRLRAIEHGRSVVHISNVGVSSLITPDGATLGWTPLFEPAILSTDLPLRSEATLAVSYTHLDVYKRQALLGALCGGLRVPDRGYPLLVALAWVATEFARRTTPYGGFPWGRLAFGVVDSPFARVAALAGAPGVGFVVALCGGYLALGALALVDRLRTRGSLDRRRTTPRPVAQVPGCLLYTSRCV